MQLSYWSATAGAVLSIISFTDSASAKCVSRALNASKTATFTVVVPETGSKELAAIGYQEVSCANLDKVAFREKVCNPISFGNSGVQAQIETQLGVPFTQLCAASRAEAGLDRFSTEEEAIRFHPSNATQQRQQRARASTLLPSSQIGSNEGNQP